MPCHEVGEERCDAACLHCGATLTQVAGPGRIRTFCTSDHDKAYRTRMRAIGFPV